VLNGCDTASSIDGLVDVTEVVGGCAVVGGLRLHLCPARCRLVLECWGRRWCLWGAAGLRNVRDGLTYWWGWQGRDWGQGSIWRGVLYGRDERRRWGDDYRLRERRRWGDDYRLREWYVECVCQRCYVSGLKHIAQ
jgi:hypothetical protein